MHKYLIMQNPGHNRVYYKESAVMALAELKIACTRFENKCQDIDLATIADNAYLSFTVKDRIGAAEGLILSRLSFIFALFEMVEHKKQMLLAPIPLSATGFIDPKISNLLKYSGKTNELFTRMMINVGLLSSDFYSDKKIRLLDPVAGKGTTLFEGAVYGFDVAGIEINKRYVHDACVFFKKFLENEKYRHRHTKTRGPSIDNMASSYIQDFEYAETKDGLKRADERKRLQFVSGDTANADRYFGKNSFHMIVGDLPYGISHGNMPKGNKQSPSRNPSMLLSDCLPHWHNVLKENGTLVLSWNTLVLSRGALSDLLTDKGFHIISPPPYDGFEHRVDSSIRRDMIVARK